MNIAQAKQQGVAAFEAGKGRAPALNNAFCVAATASGATIKMMEAYVHGWTVAMLAEGAPADMPSVKTLAAIKAAQ